MDKNSPFTCNYHRRFFSPLEMSGTAKAMYKHASEGLPSDNGNKVHAYLREFPLSC